MELLSTATFAKRPPKIAARKPRKDVVPPPNAEAAFWHSLAVAAADPHPLTALQRAVEIIGPFYGADRAWAGRYNDTLTHFWGLSDWCGPGIVSHLQEIQGTSVDVIADAHRRFLRGEVVAIPDVDRMPRQSRSLQAELRRENVRSTLAGPLFQDGKLIGFFGIDHVHGLASWTAADMDRFAVLGKFISALIHRILFVAPPVDLPTAPRKPIYVTEQNSQRALSSDEVVFIEADGDYSHVHAADGRRYFERRSLRTWIAQLPRERFLRVHQSYLVNGARIVRVDRGARWTLDLQDVPSPIPVGRAFRHAVRLHLGF
jgi:hypothetical protein